MARRRAGGSRLALAAAAAAICLNGLPWHGSAFTSAAVRACPARLCRPAWSAGLRRLPEPLRADPESASSTSDVPWVQLALAVVAAAAALIAASFSSLFKPKEYMTAGSVVKRMDMDGGGRLKVTSHGISEQEGLADLPPGSVLEYRVLRFEPCDMYLQAVAKVCVAPPGSPEPRVRQLTEALTLPYNRSLAAVVLVTLAALGAPVLAAARAAPGRAGGSGEEGEELRILCIGLGCGSVPAFFARLLPGCRVDVVESEPAVVRAAEEAMGLVTGPRLRVAVEDGAAFALRAAEEHGGQGAYDALVIDAFDAEGNVPPAMWTSGGGVPEALARGLLRPQGLVAVNFLPRTAVAPRLATYSGAMASGGGNPGLGFTVRAEEGNLMTVQTCGSFALASEEVWGRDLAKAAQEVQEATNCPFDLEELATNRLQIWQQGT